MDVRNMKAWKTAKLKYEELNTHTMFPLFGKQLSPEEIIERLEMILKESRESEKKGFASFVLLANPLVRPSKTPPFSKASYLAGGGNQIRTGE